MKVLTASTHTPEYLTHKYWARKPANVVRAFIEKYAKKNAYVFDPFCGSGVTNIESYKMGINSIGVDINPVATLIGGVSTRELDITAVEKTYNELRQLFTKKLKKYYEINGVPIRYCTHLVVVSCPACKHEQAMQDGKKCVKCGKKLVANLSTIKGSYVTSVLDVNNRTHEKKADLSSQSKASSTDLSKRLGVKSSKYDIKFIENRRILSYSDTTTKKLFTARAFSVLAFMADQIHKIEDDAIREFFLVVFTSSVAQCSRLIPSRNNLTTGGPAWSVPGFWVPKMHLECNPLTHFESRYKKLLSGVCAINKKKVSNNVETVFFNGATQEILKNNEFRKYSNKVSYVFTDPPYGDSVPYLEFSAIWNSWLKKDVDYANEVVVSDSTSRNKRWERYQIEVAQVLEAVAEVIVDEGYCTITFNHLEFDAWRTLLKGLERANLHFVDVCLVLPAVLPAKARFAVEGSYIGDYYLTFRKTKKAVKKNEDESTFREHLTNLLFAAAKKRDWSISIPHAVRIALGVILKGDYTVRSIDWAQDLIHSLFRDENKKLIWKNEREILDEQSLQSLHAEIDGYITSALENGPMETWKIIELVYGRYEFLEAPEVAEILERLYDIADKKGKFFSLEDQRQGILFS